MINAIAIAKIHQSTIYYPVYFSDENICSMFVESCKSDSIQSSENIRANVICFQIIQSGFFFLL
jgi:hypothetical protein